MRVSSNPNDVFYLTNNENLMEIQAIYLNIQVDEGTTKIFKERKNFA